MSERDAELVHAGQQAKAELSQTDAAFEKIKDGIVRQWLAAETPEARERLHAKISVLEEVRQALTAAVAHGNAASKRLNTTRD